jgi:hypothetical protein
MKTEKIHTEFGIQQKLENDNLNIFSHLKNK